MHSPRGVTNPFQRQRIQHLIQPKLTIGRADDKFEREADRVADRVVANQPVPEISSVSNAPSSSHSPDLQAETRGEEEQVQPKLAQRQTEEQDEETQPKLLQPQTEEQEEEVQPKLLQRQAEEEEEEVQPKLLQRQAEEEEEEVQPRLLQRQAEEEEEEVQPGLLQRQAEDQEQEEEVQAQLIQRRATRQPPEEEPDEVQASGSMRSAAAASRAVAQPSSGFPIRADVRSVLESGMGADLSAVRVHEDTAAHDAAASIGAKAFTHKSDIWLGAGQSQSDLHLMAHEATHVVQQGGGRQAAGVSHAAPRVQRFWNPISAVANVVSGAAEWVADTVGDVVDYVKEKASELARRMPGYSLLTVVLGEDPITGRDVERSGRNFIEAGLDVIPDGGALKSKLEEQGALDEAAQWLDEQIAELDISPTEIASQLSNFFSSLTLSDAARLSSVLDRFVDIVRGPVERIVRFAGNVASKLLEIVKNYLVSSLIDFIKEHTTAYPLLRVILGRDPISGEPVERTPIALLRGFMLLSETGAEQLRQMEESGSLQRAADWLDGAVARLNLSWETLKEAFMRVWDSVGIHSLIDPVGVFREIYDAFAGPVGRIIDFVIEVAAMVLKFIKDALISRLVEYARTIRGYPLLTVILGRDPFSDEPVERSAENIIHGFMSLMDGGEEQFQEMKQTGAIARLTTRIENAIAALNFTWEYIKGLFLRAWKSFSLQDLAAPIAAFQRLMGIFGEPLGRLIRFVGEVIRLVIEVALQLMNFPVDLISNIITRAMEAIEDIKRDPIGFLKNLLRAVKTGFVKFFDNIVTHLIRGVTGWLFRELEDAGIRPPADLSFRSILGFVLDVLGISVDRIFQKLAEKIGQDKVDRIRGVIDRLTGIWRFVSDVMTRGPVAIWEYIQEQLSNLWDTVLQAVKDWVVTRIVQRVVAKLLSMLDPTGIMAVVNGFIAFYNAVQSFIAYLREMLEIVNSFVEGVAEIARGSVERAANFLEGSLGRAVPVAIGFLANQVGLSGLGRRIGEMIERVRALVDRALDWLIDKAVQLGTSLLRSLGFGGAGEEPEEGGAATGDWRDQEGEFDDSSGHHEVTYDGNRIMVASKTPKSLETRLSEREQQEPPLTSEQKTAITQAIAKKDELETLETAYETAQSNGNVSEMQSIEAQIGAKLQEIANIVRDSNLLLGDSTVPEVVDVLDSSGNVKIRSYSRNARIGTFAPELFDGSAVLGKIQYQNAEAGGGQGTQTVDLEEQANLNYTIHEAHTLGYSKPTSFRAADRANEEEGTAYQAQRDAFPMIRSHWFDTVAPNEVDRIRQLKNAGLVEADADGVLKDGESKWRFVFGLLTPEQQGKVPRPIRKAGVKAVLDADYDQAGRDDVDRRWKERWAQGTHLHHITPLNFGGTNANFVPLSAGKHVGSGGVHPEFWSKLKPFLFSLRDIG